MYDKLIFQLSQEGRNGSILPEIDFPGGDLGAFIPENMLQEKLPILPEVSELDLVRHFIKLSQKNFCVETGFYPLGSCTMKYNPKVNEALACLGGFLNIHPYEPVELVQGALRLMVELESFLCEITGMDKFTLQPAAGAHGELTSLLIARKYLDHIRQTGRNKILIPDSAHGTNPASSVMAGMETVQIKSDNNGNVDLESLQVNLDEKTACLMLTNPNTLGLFETNILKISQVVHSRGALMYYDGANANAILGCVRPADMGFDLIHLNLHKTFSTPHGGGGPGSGPVGVKKKFIPFLPKPHIEFEKESQRFVLNYDLPLSIGKVKSFYGNFLVLVKAYAYIRMLGAKGLKEVSEIAVLNANYLMKALSDVYELPYKRICQHEFVLSAVKQKEKGVKALDIAKRLLDYGFHAPTIYFPLIVPEALMIEPTETESKQTLDEFIKIMKKIDREAEENPDLLTGAPVKTPVKRLDEAGAARKLNLRCQP